MLMGALCGKTDDYGLYAYAISIAAMPWRTWLGEHSGEAQKANKGRTASACMRLLDICRHARLSLHQF
jgi:hypothetical protein